MRDPGAAPQQCGRHIYCGPTRLVTLRGRSRFGSRFSDFSPVVIWTTRQTSGLAPVVGNVSREWPQHGEEEESEGASGSKHSGQRRRRGHLDHNVERYTGSLNFSLVWS